MGAHLPGAVFSRLPDVQGGKGAAVFHHRIQALPVGPAGALVEGGLAQVLAVVQAFQVGDVFFFTGKFRWGEAGGLVQLVILLLLHLSEITAHGGGRGAGLVPFQGLPQQGTQHGRQHQHSHKEKGKPLPEAAPAAGVLFCHGRFLISR